MQIQAERSGQALVVRLAGELDLHTAPAFREAVDKRLRADARIRHLVLVMDEVTFVDSSGIGVLLGRGKQVLSRGGRVVAVGLRPHLQKLFTFTGLTRLFEMVQDERQALQGL